MNLSLVQLPLLACMQDRRQSLDQEVLEELKKRYQIFPTVIPKRIRISEEMAARFPCTNESYELFTQEFLKEIGHGTEEI